MILLDTDVVWQPLDPATGDPNVFAWFDQQIIETLYFSTVGLAEVRLRIASLPEGKERDGIRYNFEKGVVRLMPGRILPFDELIAESYAVHCTRAANAGHPMTQTEGYVAAIAASRNLIVATKNPAPFIAAGIKTINPWTCNVNTTPTPINLPAQPVFEQETVDA